MWALLFMGVTSAAELELPQETLQPTVLRADVVQSRRKKGKKGKRGKRGPDWAHEFYARPALGGSTYTDADGNASTAIALGGQGGVRYWQRKRKNPIYAGRSRVQVQYIAATTGDTTGMEVKVGSFMGPQWLGPKRSYVGLSSGLDVFWNRYTFGEVTLDPTVGVGVPVIGSAGVKLIGMYAGFEPAWIANADRRVDWSEQEYFGFGHQFSTFLGGQLNLGGTSVGVNYTRTITAYGVQQGYGLSMNLRG